MALPECADPELSDQPIYEVRRATLPVEASPSFTFLSALDAVHPNEQGQQAIAEVMARAVERECR